MPQARAVLTKNLILAARNRRDLLRELFLPLIFLAVLLYLARSSPAASFPAVAAPPSQPLAPLAAAALAAGRGALWVAPCGDVAVAAIAAALARAYAGPRLGVSCFAGAREVDANYSAGGGANVFAAVIFDAPLAPPRVRYALRLDPALVPGAAGAPNMTRARGAGGAALPPSGLPLAYARSLLPLQAAVDAALADVLAPRGARARTDLAFRRFPAPAFEVDANAAVLAALVPTFLTFIFTLQVRVLLTRLLEEKERRLRSAMRVMGLGDALYVGTWVATAGVKNGALVLVVAAIVCGAGLFSHASAAVVAAVFLAFCASCIAFSLMAASLFSNSRTGGAIGMVLYIVASLPAYALTTSDLSGAAKLAFASLAPCAFSLAASVLTRAEAAGAATTFANWTDASDIGVSLAALTAALLADTVAYLALAFYLDRVLRADGITLHPLFCCGVRHARAGASGEREVARARAGARGAPLGINDDGESERDDLLAHAEAPAAPRAPASGAEAAAAGILSSRGVCEPVHADVAARPGVVIANVSKVFYSAAGARLALDDLSLECREGQVTVLLGHNGAGKSTLASIITGQVAATAGDVRVFGTSVNDDVEGVQAMVGYCPQHDTCFDQLTVREHLLLFGGIKRVAAGALAARVDELIADVGLAEKADAFAATLSGGQKRRLSVAIALVGMPRLLILDEPTSGLDPSARRAIWALIAKYKAGRAVLLVTHFMDEADMLGDRIVLLARGRVRVAGAPLFVRAHFSLAYTLSVAFAGGDAAPARVAALAALVRGALPAAALLGVAAGEATFSLPRADAERFPQLLAALEAAQERGDAAGIAALAVSITSLEECFLALQALVEVEEEADKERAGAATARRGGAGSAAAAAAAAAAALPPDAWLDVRRRAFVHGPAADAVALAAETGLAPAPLIERGSLAAAARQLRVQLARHVLQLRRDVRLVLLQVVVPVAVTALSLLFRFLSGVGAAALAGAPVAFTPAAFGAAPGGAWALPWAAVGGASAAALNATASALPFAAAPLLPPPASLDAASAALVGASYAAAAFVLDGAAGPPGGNGTLTILYNDTLTTVLPTLLALVGGAQLGAALGAPPGAASISVTFTAFPVAPSSLPTLGSYLSGALSGMYVATGFAVIPAVQASMIVAERETRAKQMQLIMGATHAGYWLSQWLFDAALFVVPWAAATALLLTVGAPSFQTAANAPAVSALVLLYGLSCPWTTYAVSFAFEKQADAQLWVRLYFTLGTVILFFCSFALTLPQLLSGGAAPAPLLAAALNYAGMILLPPYSLAQGLSDIAVRASCLPGALPACVPPSPWAYDIVGQRLLFLALGIPFWAAAVFFLERRAAGGGAAPAAPLPPPSDDDEDVAAEAARVERDSAGGAGDGATLRGLRKEYASRGRAAVKVAVRALSLRVAEGDVFGLLGPNGAGKTTTLAMLVGEVAPTRGAALLYGAPVAAARRAALDELGFCPQADALFPSLTGAENLAFYAALSGAPAAHVALLVAQALEAVDIAALGALPVAAFSGGNKRRLSLAVAYIAAPRVVALDEASTGVDPVARRAMFRVIQRAAARRATLMTSHVIEEADALCSRVGVLVDGRLAALGAPAHVKARFGGGATVEVAFSAALDARGCARAAEALAAALPAALAECAGGRARFDAPRGLRLSRAFAALNAARARGDVAEFGVVRGSLEAVFLRFARAQEAADERARRGGGGGDV